MNPSTTCLPSTISAILRRFSFIIVPAEMNGRVVDGSDDGQTGRHHNLLKTRYFRSNVYCLLSILRKRKIGKKAQEKEYARERVDSRRGPSCLEPTPHLPHPIERP